jgi:hypothetical protein
MNSFPLIEVVSDIFVRDATGCKRRLHLFLGDHPAGKDSYMVRGLSRGGIETGKSLIEATKAANG